MSVRVFTLASCSAIGAACLLASACEPALDSAPAAARDAAEPLPGDSAAARPTDAGISPAIEACSPGSTASCPCPRADDGTLRTGTRPCTSGLLGACSCEPDPALADTGVEACKPGLYAGSFKGNYTSTLGLLEVPLALAPVSPDEPEIEFTLAYDTARPGQLFVVGGGLRVSASSAFELMGSVTGTLDCAAKVFSASVNGTTTSLAPEPFSAELTANYDAASLSFNQGEWNASSGNDQRGTGTWSAVWISKALPPGP